MIAVKGRKATGVDMQDEEGEESLWALLGPKALQGTTGASITVTWGPITVTWGPITVTWGPITVTWGPITVTWSFTSVIGLPARFSLEILHQLFSRDFFH